MQKTAYAQLSGLMFFQLLVMGAFQPVIGTYLKDTLHFSGTQTGVILTAFQVASMAAPLVAAFVVDRVVSARLLFAVLHLVSAVVAFSLIHVKEFLPFLVLFGVYAFFLGPTNGLVNALSFARMPDGRRHYGAVRLWGTVGWIVAAFVMAGLWLIPGSTMDWIFGVSCASSLIAAAVTLVLPHVPTRKPEGKFELFPKDAFKVFLQPALIQFGVLWFFSGILDRFYYIATSPYLAQLGFKMGEIMPVMTLGQVTEVFLLLLTGTVLKRWGLRNVLLLGLTMQLLRFVLMLTNWGPGWILLALSLNGFVFAFFYAVGTIFVDAHTQPFTRGGVHQLMGLIFGGTSSVVGSLLTGLAFDWFGKNGVVDYHEYWWIPVGLAALALSLVPVFFSSRVKIAPVPPEQ